MEKLLLGSSELATTTDSSQPQVQEVVPQSLKLKPQQLSNMYQKLLSHHVLVLRASSAFERSQGSKHFLKLQWIHFIGSGTIHLSFQI